MTSDIKSKLLSKKSKTFFKILVSIILLTYFLLHANISSTLKVLLSSNIFYVVLCVLIYFIGQVISAYKWGIIAKKMEFKTNTLDFIRYYFIGMYFNLFLPSTIGGDVGKAYYLYRNEPSRKKTEAIFSIIIDRVTGLFILLIMATIASFTKYAANLPTYITSGITVITFCAFVTLFLVYFTLNKSLIPVKFLSIEYQEYLRNLVSIKFLLTIFLYSLLFHISVILIHIFIGYSINIDINPIYYFIIYPIVSILGFIPIAFNGIGIREGAYIFLFSLLSVNKSLGFSFGIIWLFVVVINSLLGGIFYINNNIKIENSDFADQADN